MSRRIPQIDAWVTDNGYWETIKPGLHQTKLITVSEPDDKYKVVGTLSKVDLGPIWDNSLDIHTWVDSITPSQFSIHVKSLNTRIFNTSLSWLKTDAQDTSIQTGVYSFSSSGQYAYHEAKTTISFPYRYAMPPKIFVGFSGWRQSRGWSLATWAMNITSTDFELRIGTVGETSLRGAEVTWIAFPRDAIDIIAGEFSYDGDGKEPRSGEVMFPTSFKNTPSVLLAFTKFAVMDHFHCGLDLGKVTTSSVKYGITPWAGTHLHSVTASYLAIDTVAMSMSSTKCRHPQVSTLDPEEFVGDLDDCVGDPNDSVASSLGFDVLAYP